MSINNTTFSFTSASSKLTAEKLTSLVGTFDKYPVTKTFDDRGEYVKAGEKSDGAVYGSINDGTGYSEPQPDELADMRAAGYPVDEYLNEYSAWSRLGLSGRGDNWKSGDGINPANFAAWIVKKYDLNNDGSVDAYEALKSGCKFFDTAEIQKYSPKLEQLKTLLDVDANHDGVLQRDGKGSEYYNLLSKYDVDGDGKLTLNEQGAYKKDFGQYFFHTSIVDGIRTTAPMTLVDIAGASKADFLMDGKSVSSIPIKDFL